MENIIGVLKKRSIEKDKTMDQAGQASRKSYFKKEE
jgi:hypothetical protein